MPVKKCDDIQEGAVESTTEAPEIEVTRVTVTPSQVRENVYLGKNITAVVILRYMKSFEVLY